MASVTFPRGTTSPEVLSHPSELSFQRERERDLRVTIKLSRCDRELPEWKHWRIKRVSARRHAGERKKKIVFVSSPEGCNSIRSPKTSFQPLAKADTSLNKIQMSEREKRIMRVRPEPKERSKLVLIVVLMRSPARSINEQFRTRLSLFLLNRMCSSC